MTDQGRTKMTEDLLEIIDEIQDDIGKRYGISLGIQARDYVTTDFDEVKEAFSRVHNVPESDRERAMHYSLWSEENGVSELDHLIHIPEQYETILEDADNYPLEDVIDAIAAIVEEVSHFCYTESFSRKFGTEPKSLNTELIGSIDKYYTIQNKLGGLLDEKNIAAEPFCFEANTKQFLFIKEPQYFIGQRLAYGAVEFLENNLTEEEKSEWLKSFYLAKNSEQINHLLYRIGITFESYSPEQAKIIKEYFNDDPDLKPILRMDRGE